MNLGKAIKKVRTEKGISQKDLAEMVDISPSSMSQIESGIKRPNKANLTKICIALKVPEAILYLSALEEVDIPQEKRKVFRLLFPSLEEIVKAFH